MHQFRSMNMKWFTACAFVLVLLISECQIEASKSSRNRNSHGSSGRSPSSNSNSRHAPNAEHVRLTHGDAPVRQSHIPNQHAAPPISHSPPYPVQQPRPSAPELPKSHDAGVNKPVGWNVGHNNDVQQKQTVSNTQSGYPHQSNLPPYSAVNHGAPPPYSPHGNVPHVNAAPPSYSPSAGAVPSYPG